MSLTVFNIANNQKCLLSSKSVYYDFWRSCDTEDWSNDAEKYPIDRSEMCCKCHFGRSSTEERLWKQIRFLLDKAQLYKGDFFLHLISVNSISKTRCTCSSYLFPVFGGRSPCCCEHNLAGKTRSPPLSWSVRHNPKWLEYDQPHKSEVQWESKRSDPQQWI